SLSHESLVRVQLFFLGTADPRALHSFPTRRSSDLLPGREHRLDVLSAVLEVEGDVVARPDPAVRQVVRQAVGPLLELRVGAPLRSEEHTSELQSRENLVCRLLLEKKKQRKRGRRQD